MNKKSTVHIIHHDDQPEFTTWLPGALRLEFQKKYKKIINMTVGDKGKSSIASFIIPHSDNETIEVIYDIQTDESRFRERYLKLKDHGLKLAIFDVHLKGIRTAGAKMVHDMAKNGQLYKNTKHIFLTGFPNDTRQYLNLHKILNFDVIGKPPNALDLANIICEIITAEREVVEGEHADDG